MKRGQSGLSLLVAVDKPSGMTSHDVVNRCRRIFGEKRVGHTGTLDPLATGVLPICVGPATRLDQYLTAHDKRYRVNVSFGHETTTDDSEGEPTVYGRAGAELFDRDFAQSYVQSLVGEHEQVPPQYSSVRIDGKKAYQIARSGSEAHIEPRRIEVYDARLVDCFEDVSTGMLTWTVDFSVSKGTYIRSLARDMGRQLDCPAHVSGLRRQVAGSIQLADCVSLETLQARGVETALDPVEVLGLRYAFGDDSGKQLVSGARLPESCVKLNEPIVRDVEASLCACTSIVVPSVEGPSDGELVSIVMENRLKAVYAYSARECAYLPACVFSIGVSRG